MSIINEITDDDSPNLQKKANNQNEHSKIIINKLIKEKKNLKEKIDKQKESILFLLSEIKNIINENEEENKNKLKKIKEKITNYEENFEKLEGFL